MNTNCKIFTNNVEEKALNQIKSLQENPLYNNAILRFMPDVHAGYGCTIGTTIRIPYKVIEQVKLSPHLIGNDIGCGVRAYQVGQLKNNLKWEDVIDFDKLDSYIRNNVPSGNSIHKSPIIDHCIFSALKMPFTEEEKLRIRKSFGTLGGGNHFIELDIDEKKQPLDCCSYWK